MSTTKTGAQPVTDENMRIATVRERLTDTLASVDDPAPEYRGKVRDVFRRGDEMFIVTTDRVSAFDVVLGTIPLKGALLTEQAVFWLERARDVVPTHLLERIDAQVMRCKVARALPVELVVRGYLAGSLMREPPASRGHAYGLSLPSDLEDYAKLATPIVTPTTKAPTGEHDLPLSTDEIVARGLVDRHVLTAATEAALELFRRGAEFALSRGLILVDTKYEFGLVGDTLVVIDEIHTADSSRYWLSETYASRRSAGEAPDMLDKERLRRWLLAQGFSGHGAPPALSDDIRIDLAAHYWALTETVTGAPFVPPAPHAPRRVANAVRRALAS
jgi:phosphoribosylaminoimidazole-succinocarboxamide synthase